ncbi:hypothetical protein [Spirosoma sp. KNUC1025]|uniref:hypothetical protein n=1 Tax=Spirosoma sp. KNUC1025 TaxID=2894082 RepID=UPI00386C708F|nr:hypothetical protein LN737_16135 [Spirosoma sp. KNUC1025]
MAFFYRLSVLVFLITFAAVQGLAQSQSHSTAPYLIFKTTYAFPASSLKIDEAVATVNKRTFTQGVYGSYGKGLNLSLGVGKMLNPTFGVELNAQLLLGSALTTTYSSDADSTSGSVSSRVRGVILKPFIVVRNSGDLLSIYTKLGLAIVTYARRYEQLDLQTIIDNSDYHLSTEATDISKPKVGFAACFGLSFRISESISLFVEANGQILSLPITKGHYTKYTLNGKDGLPTMKTSEKSWVYERSTTSDPNAQANDSKPGVQLYDPAYLSNVGVGAGFIYHF